MRKWAVATSALAVAGVASFGTPALGGGEKISFPDNYAAGVPYAKGDSADAKQYREYFAPAAAIAAAKKGEPMPDGTVITMVMYAALLDAAGRPQKTLSGAFIKGNRVGYAVMEKHAGWGADYVPQYRNGEWEYQVFTLDKKVNDKANLSSCFQCHKAMQKQDFVFTYDKMKAAP